MSGTAIYKESVVFVPKLNISSVIYLNLLLNNDIVFGKSYYKDILIGDELNEGHCL